MRFRSLDAPSRVNPHLDGGWWPRSYELATELPSLFTAAAEVGFDVHHVHYRLHAWGESPRRLHAVPEVGGHRVILSGQRHQAEDTVILVDGSGRRRMQLLVVPPDADAEFADQALAIAGRDNDADPASEVLLRAAAPSPATTGDRGALPRPS